MVILGEQFRFVEITNTAVSNQVKIITTIPLPQDKGKQSSGKTYQLISLSHICLHAKREKCLLNLRAAETVLIETIFVQSLAMLLP